METIISYILHPETMPSPYSDIFFILRIVSLIISFLFLTFIFLVFLKTQWLNKRYFDDFNEFVKFKPHEINKLVKDWKKIIAKQESGSEAEYKLAIIEADTMMGDILKRMGYTEETIEDRLKNISESDLKNMSELIEVRKTRNSVVYDPDYELTIQKTRDVLKVYEEAFKNLGAFS
jgi:hypothetical protein